MLYSAVSDLQVSLYYPEIVIRYSFPYIKQKLNEKISVNFISLSFALKKMLELELLNLIGKFLDVELLNTVGFY